MFELSFLRVRILPPPTLSGKVHKTFLFAARARICSHILYYRGPVFCMCKNDKVQHRSRHRRRHAAHTTRPCGMQETYVHPCVQFKMGIVVTMKEKHDVIARSQSNIPLAKNSALKFIEIHFKYRIWHCVLCNIRIPTCLNCNDSFFCLNTYVHIAQAGS